MDKTKLPMTGMVAQMVRDKFVSGEISPLTTTARPVYDSLCAEDERISKIPFKTFSARFNAIRTTYRMKAIEESKTTSKSVKGDGDTGPTAKKRSAQGDDFEADAGRELVSGDPLALRTFVHRSYYRMRDRTQHVRLIVHLPSGVNNDDVQAEVVDGGFTLHIKVKVPKLLLDINRIHKKEIEKGELNIDDSVILSGFEDYLSTVQAASGADVFQTMRIPLEIHAQPKIFTKYTKEDKASGVHVFCCELREEEAAYLVGGDPVKKIEM